MTQNKLMREIEYAIEFAFSDLDPREWSWEFRPPLNEDIKTIWFYHFDKPIARTEIFLPPVEPGKGDDELPQDIPKGYGGIAFRDPFNKDEPPQDAAWSIIESRVQPAFERVFGWANKLEEEISTEATIGDGEVKLASGFPRTQKTQDKWKESFQCILDLREEFCEQFEEGYTENPDPSLDDCREALASMSIWKKRPSASTVSRIMKYGDEGLLG